jgi:hypothetical protein
MLADSSNGLDAVTYFFANSGLFFLVTAVLFFGFGTLFGAATWGRYKRRFLKSEEVIEANRVELAQLKRRLAEREKGGRTPAAAQATVFTPPSFNPPSFNPPPVLSPLAALVRGQNRPPEVAEIRAFPSLSAFPPGRGFSIWTEPGWEPGLAPVIVPPSAAFSLWTQEGNAEDAGTSTSTHATTHAGDADWLYTLEHGTRAPAPRSHAFTVWTDRHWTPPPISHLAQAPAAAFSIWTLAGFVPLCRGAQMSAQAFSLWTEPSWNPPKISGLPPRSARSFSLWTEDDFVPSGKAAALPSLAWNLWTAEDWEMPDIQPAPQIGSAAFSLWTEAGWAPSVPETVARNSDGALAAKTPHEKRPPTPRGIFSRLFGVFKTS